MKAIRRFTVRPVLPGPLAPLNELARNLRWSWHPPTRELFRSVDPGRFEETGGDPLRLLGCVPPARLAELAAEDGFLARLAEAHQDLRGYLEGARWYQEQGAGQPAAIAYFSPEFGITAALPQYSGGLGILAGDHLKSASDLGVPLIGVGLLYRHGYFRQSLSREGWQQEHYPVLDPHELPLHLLRESDGSPALTVLALPGGRLLRARIWQAQVGRVPLLLLDSAVEENDRAAREVTDRLYGGGSEHRLLQEMLLGIGGVRAVRAYCRLTGHPAPEVFHTNEGHAGFLGLERLHEYTQARDGRPGADFGSALERVAAGTVFTTHTPVPAGIDRFETALVARHFGPEAELPGIETGHVLALGTETGEGADPGVFNMAVMGLRLARRANGVSQLHGRVSREMFAGLWPGFDAEEVPITSITNGVHAPTWTAPEVRALGARGIGAERVEEAVALGGPERAAAVGAVPGAELWELRRTLRTQLVGEVRRRLWDSWRERGASAAELGWIERVFDPGILTVGFARRVPSYKRLTLMLRDPDRLRALLLHPERPVQIVVAGKAHPADDGGKRLVQALVRFTDDPRVRERIVFLPDYGMAMAEKLYPGCDVWLNNPLRPLEACGTSGMKAALNGCLNLSVLDGWWDEWYEPDFGWAVPTADGDAADEDRRDDLEARALYELLERRVAPRFYERGPEGLPDRWIEMVRRTLTQLGPKVLAGRMVREYVTRLYAPAARAARAMDEDASRELAWFKGRLRAAWPQVAVEHVEASATSASAEVGSTLALRVGVRLGELGPDDVQVQALTGRVDSADRISSPTTVALKPLGGPDLDGRLRYEGPLTLDRTGPIGYTVRVLPAHRLLGGAAELGLVAWPSEGAGESGVLLR
ncbi:alpha-glucan family phosphorylase [Streptomyces physcomitrii]|uniref:glycogen phosphorylase n=1 Tax=Streptomyces physcomitrii TaxID=2724184 RepID=A0ABX1HDM2_9ACTN|nr:alpha-glucan family phosphorylase [Streptomyces physcomitrii]NKI45319.1 glycosyltransferase family 1 protein [Streptomyces physcomitrii]